MIKLTDSVKGKLVHIKHHMIWTFKAPTKD